MSRVVSDQIRLDLPAFFEVVKFLGHFLATFPEQRRIARPEELKHKELFTSTA